MGFKLVFVSLSVGGALAWGVPGAGSLEKAAARVEQIAAQSPAGLRPEFRILAAQALKGRYPELAKKFVLASLADFRTRDTIDLLLLDTMAELAPEETIALLPHLKPGSEFDVAGAFMRTNQPRRAAPIYRASFKKGPLRTDIAPLFQRLAKEDPDDAKVLFIDFLAAFSFDAATPYDLFGMTNCAGAMAQLDPVRAADVYDRVLRIASAADYGKNGSPTLTASFQVGATKIATATSRDTLLLAAGARLRTLAPDRFEKYKDALAPWPLNGSFAVKRFSYGTPPPAPPVSPAELALSERMEKLRSLPASARPAEVLELARAIQALPKGSKSNLAETLAGLATEGDNGKEALAAVAAALGQSIQEGAPRVQVYIELASLVRYEHAPAPFSDRALDAADAVLALRDSIYQEASFTLTGLDGKIYSLPALRGKVVLLNFWATWCLPCREEMPDLDALCRRFGAKGLVILAVSAEDRETVAGFLAKQSYMFPVLLDPARKANDSFAVDSIPKSFIFDREGKLAAFAIDKRTEGQFAVLLKAAGLR